jgi:hypothetical protein
MRKHLLTLAAVLVAAPLASGESIDEKRYVGHVKFLASPALRGRGTGSPELAKAAAYLEGEFRKLGLKPPGRWRQTLTVTVNAKPGPASRVALNGAPLDPKDFALFNFSGTGEAAGAAVFAGYGITAGELNYDDYAGIDVKDKIAVVLKNEPQMNDDTSVFAGKLLTAHAQFANKAANAKLHGARALVVISEDELEPFGRAAGAADARIPCVIVKASAFEKAFRDAGRPLGEIIAGIDRDLTPRSFAFPEDLKLSVKTEVIRESRPTDNVMAYLAGETSEYVVIGAHYDHLGLGYQSSLAPDKAGTPHPGADDNASGAAGLLELARYFARQPKQKRGILFLAFTGEELGLLGSAWYVKNPALPLKDCVAMLNLDMIGRPREGRLFVGGVGTGSTLGRILDEAKARSSLKVDVSQIGGIGSSDHTSFTTQQVPVLFFFSGLHGDYHKPSDTWDKIDGPNAVKVLELVADIATRLRTAEDRPVFIRVAEPPQRSGAGGRGYGPVFGSIPDFNEPPKGVRFADVREGTPAAKAGLKAGDILIGWDGAEIANLQDFTTALRSRKPGDVVKVKILRGAETLEIPVTLEARR